MNLLEKMMTAPHYEIDFSKEKLTGYTVLVNAVTVLTAIFFLFSFVLGVSRVEGTSMSPTLSDHQIVLYTRLSSHPLRGDIVAMVTPAGAHYIKRVAAVPGDTVDIHDGHLYVNGTVEDNAYAVGATETETITEYPITLEDGMYFLLGDNREASADSRTFGPVAIGQIEGIILGK